MSEHAYDLGAVPAREDPRAPAGWLAGAAPAGIVVGAAVVAGLVVTAGARGAALAAAVSGVLLLGSLARLTGGFAGPGSADLMLRLSGTTGPDGVRVRRDAAERLLGATVSGIALLAGSAVGWLAVAGAPADRLVAVTAGAGLALRSRMFAGWSARLLGGTGLATAVLAAVRVAAAPPVLGGWLAVATGGAVAGVALAVTQARRVPQRAGRLLRWAEPTLVTTMICTAALAAGLPDAAGR
ncbi:hypothetical protein ABZS66_51080 [Dactylosporangium sp. NPDC005572]|uniref:hypothetical protein n=1 Tax=Dactylosporangium sp. NPDC005572 TaxID=3156889 RepID=UPI0033BEFEFA